MYDYIDFKYTNFDGKEVTCQVLSILPTEGNDFFVLFTDGEKDVDGIPIIKYGKMIEHDGEYELKGNIEEDELQKMKDYFSKEIQTLTDHYKGGMFYDATENQ